MNFTFIEPGKHRCPPQSCFAALKRKPEKAEYRRIKTEKAEKAETQIWASKKADLSSTRNEGYCGSDCEKS